MTTLSKQQPALCFKLAASYGVVMFAVFLIIALSGCGGNTYKGLVMDETAIEEPPPAPPGFTEALTLSPSEALQAEPENTDEDQDEDAENIDDELETEQVEPDEKPDKASGKTIQEIQGAGQKEDVKLDTDLKKLKNIKKHSKDVNQAIKKVESQAPKTEEANNPEKTTVSDKSTTEVSKPEQSESIEPKADVTEDADSQAIPETVIKLPVKKSSPSNASKLKIDSLDPPHKVSIKIRYRYEF